MKWPRYTAQTPPPRISGEARATNIGALTQTGEQAKWSGIGAFGRGMGFVADLAFRASQNRQAIDDTIEWGTATSRVKDRFRLASDAAERMDVSMDMPLPDDPDYLKTLTSFSTIKRDQLLNEALKDIEKDVGKLSQIFSNPKNKAQFENWYNDNYDSLADGLRSMYNKKLDSYQRAEMDKLRETAAENGDIGTADKFTTLMDKYELITPETAEVLKKNNRIIEKKARANLVWQAALISATDSEGNVIWQDVLNFLNQPRNTKGVEPEIVDSLVENAETQHRIQTAKTDKPEYWRMLREITENPNESQRKELIDLAEAGKLEETDRKYLEGKIDAKDDPLKTPRAQLYFNSLDTLFDERETDTEQRMKYDIANEKLVQFFETTKTPTAKQAAEFYDELINPEVLTWIERLMWTDRPQLFGLIGTEEERRAKKKAKKGITTEKSPYPEYPDAFEEDGVWKVIRDGKKYRIE